MFGLCFQAYDGKLLSPVWNRCWDHSTEPIPATAPPGSYVTVSSPKPPALTLAP